MDTINTPTPQQFEAVRDQNEQIYWTGRPACLPFFLTGVPLLLVGLLWGTIDYSFIRQMLHGMLYHGQAMRLNGFPLLFILCHALLPGVLGMLNMARLFLAYGNTCYAYTNKRLMMRSGFWGIDFKTIDYDKIQELEVDVDPIENVLGVGTIRAFSGSTTSKGTRIYDEFAAIPRPYDVFKNIKQVSVDIKTDWNYPNALRPEDNPGYRTQYTPKQN